MTGVEVVVGETSATDRTVEIPLSHLSVELGHLYMEELVDGSVDLPAYFGRIATWTGPDQLADLARVPRSRLRASTCVLVDDYAAAPLGPDVVVPRLIAAARCAGLTIDYIARESGCAAPMDGAAALAGPRPAASLADLVEGLIVADPAAGFNGNRPPVHENGWLCNGVRSPAGGARQAMRAPVAWQPPVENRAHRHSIFLDVEIWREQGAGRRWSCPFLATVWQLLRLGQLRVLGRPAATPVGIDPDDLPATWAQFPTIAQLPGHAAPFTAYRTLSVLDGRFLPVEHAVRMTLGQVAVDPIVAEQTLRRAGRENVPLPAELPDRVGHVFLGG
ncbi:MULTISPECIES: SCO2522 family protein [Frankia]|uniref:SCO2522 family protein n=1 Tax=Frankia TaxID=1854 RepID=UPI000696304F|nr:MULTISPECIES: SCO2522 family protein [Frankia]